MKHTFSLLTILKYLFVFNLMLIMAASAWGQSAPEAELQALNEENLKAGIAERVRNTRGAQDEAYKTFSSDQVEVFRKKAIQIGSMTVFAVQIKVHPPKAGDPPDLISVVVSADGIYQFSEIQTLADGRSMVREALAEVKRIDSLPADLGKEIFSGDGLNEVVVISDPFCPHCRRGWEYVLENQHRFKSLRLAHFPLNPGSEAAVWAATEVWQQPDKYDTLAPSEALNFIYGNLAPSQNPSEIVSQFIQAWPELQTLWGEDAASASQYLRQARQAEVQQERNRIQALGISSTPIFFVNGEMVEGFNAGRLNSLLR